MTTPVIVEQSIEHLDFATPCRATRTDAPDSPCPETAVAYIEMHRVADCKHPICNPHGNMCGNVCQRHIDILTAAARSIIDIPDKTALLVCGTCGKHLTTVSDIIIRLEQL